MIAGVRLGAWMRPGPGDWYRGRCPNTSLHHNGIWYLGTYGLADAPHVVDYGRNMEDGPDGKMYLVGHGSPEPDAETRKANLSWIAAATERDCPGANASERQGDSGEVIRVVVLQVSTRCVHAFLRLSYTGWV